MKIFHILILSTISIFNCDRLFSQDLGIKSRDTLNTEQLHISGSIYSNDLTCENCLVKYPVEINQSHLSKFQHLLQIKSELSTFYDSTIDPMQVIKMDYSLIKKQGHLEILCVQGSDTTYQKGNFRLSDTVYNGFYVKENVTYKYYKLIKDGIWNIGKKGDYYTYQNNILHGMYQTHDTPEGETGQYMNGHSIGLCQSFDSNGSKYIEDFYDLSGNWLYTKEYKTIPIKTLYKETYLVIDDKMNDSTSKFDMSKRFYFKKYDVNGKLISDGFKRYDPKKEDTVFYGIHKEYNNGELIAITKYNEFGKIINNKKFNKPK